MENGESFAIPAATEFTLAYIKFREQFRIDETVQLLDDADNSSTLFSVVSIVKANLFELLKYPSENSEQQKNNLIDLKEILEEASSKFAGTRILKLNHEVKAFRGKSITWDVTDFKSIEFTSVKSKNKSRQPNEEHLANNKN
ncbi:hypothetical protein NPIL_638491 [Nephila pilipes]|uniref:Uncharacterized protein n=1 Tax=Nephila pilipes TaxID=299642 RepID=A0A8X6MXU5_NEPPI|nr:hypothetical protein NPIL_638491 [Nephila pilipes]